MSTRTERPEPDWVPGVTGCVGFTKVDECYVQSRDMRPEPSIVRPVE